MQFFCICQFEKKYIFKITNNRHPKFSATFELVQRTNFRKLSTLHGANMNQCDTCQE